MTHQTEAEKTAALEIALVESGIFNDSDESITGAVYSKTNGDIVAYTINHPWYDCGSMDVSTSRKGGNEVFDMQSHGWVRKP